MRSQKKSKNSNIIPVERIANKIYVIREQKVILDKDIAELYEIPTGRLNEQVKRNIKRFPNDFMFQLTKEEYEVLKSQNAISKTKRGGRRYNPFAFTEQGIAMLSSVINSERAIEVNILIMRAFVKLREILSTHKELADKLKELELKLDTHDEQIQVIIETINQLLTEPEKPKKKMGFEIGN